MRHISILLIVLLTLPALSYAQMESEGYTVTENQMNFASSLTQLTNIIKAGWKSPVDLWVEGVFENKPKEAQKQQAGEIADRVLLMAQNEGLDQSFCVNVHNGNYIPLETKCWEAP